MTQAQVNKLPPMKVRKLQLQGKIPYRMLEEYVKYHNTKSSYAHNGQR